MLGGACLASLSVVKQGTLGPRMEIGQDSPACAEQSSEMGVSELGGACGTFPGSLCPPSQVEAEVWPWGLWLQESFLSDSKK